jgi:uncharacterized FAD-dependent dehydrogenase
MLKDRYDVIVVGAGPAGIFAAMELAQHDDLSILMIEKGKDIEHRSCPSVTRHLACAACQPCDLVSGWGGAGAFSDGKLTISAEVGGRLSEYLGREQTEELVRYVDAVYQRFGDTSQLYPTGDTTDIARRASLAELRLIPTPLRHLGTDHCRELLERLRDELARRVDIATGTTATEIALRDGALEGIETSAGGRICCRYLVLAPGREGADWLVREWRRLGLSLNSNAVDVGVRVEVPSAVLEELTTALYEPKLEFYSRSFEDRIRTFCVCPHGEVTMESTAGAEPVLTVNGHSYSGRKTENTNFALLVSTTFTEPFREPIAYGRYLARLANILSGGVLVQRLGDLLEGRRSTPARMKRGLVEPTLENATPGDLSFVLPYRHLKGIIEMLGAMDRLSPGVSSRHTLLYGVEVKFYSSRLTLSPSLETEIANAFAAGDGAGVTRGLVQASASGVAVAREILRRAGRSDEDEPARAALRTRRADAAA